MTVIGKKVLVVYDKPISKVLITKCNFIIVINEDLNLQQKQMEIIKMLQILEETYGVCTRKDRVKRYNLSS